MNKYDDVIFKYQKKNQILFSRDSESLHELLSLFREQKHRTLVLWAFFLIDEINTEIKKELEAEKRVNNAIELCKLWAQGKVKMNIAKKALLEVHSICKEITDSVLIAKLHAIGQGLATIHVETHAIGLAIYELTSIVLENGIDDFTEKVEKRIRYYLDLLNKCTNEIDKYEWALFLLDDTRPNKEALLYKKGSLKNE